jgi:hypothetical protein
MGLEIRGSISGTGKETSPSPIHPHRLRSSCHLLKGQRGHLSREKRSQVVKLTTHILLDWRFSTPATCLHGVDSDNFTSNSLLYQGIQIWHSEH